MAGFAVVPEGVARAGGAGQAAADQLAGADCAAPARQITGAVSGGETAGAATEFTESWLSAFATSRTDVGENATALTTATRTYTTRDTTAAEALPDRTGTGAGRIGGPV